MLYLALVLAISIGILLIWVTITFFVVSALIGPILFVGGIILLAGLFFYGIYLMTTGSDGAVIGFVLIIVGVLVSYAIFADKSGQRGCNCTRAALTSINCAGGAVTSSNGGVCKLVDEGFIVESNGFTTGRNCPCRTSNDCFSEFNQRCYKVERGRTGVGSQVCLNPYTVNNFRQSGYVFSEK